MYGFVGNNGVNAWDYLGLVDPNVWLDGKDPKPCSPHKYFDYDLDVSKVVLTITASPKYTVINKPKLIGHAPGTIFAYINAKGEVGIKLKCIQVDCYCVKKVAVEMDIKFDLAVSVETQGNILIGGPVMTAYKVGNAANKVSQVMDFLGKEAKAKAKASNFCPGSR